MKNLRILIADDHEVLVEGVRRLIESQPGWEVCAIAATGREAVEKTERLRPDVALLDMSMPELNGLEAARQIKHRVPETEILLFTAHQTEDLIRDAFASGVKGFVVKFEAASHLIDAIKALSQHQPYFTGKVASILFDIALHPPPDRSGEANRNQLTGRERELLQLVAEGKSNKEVATALGISVRTVEKHRATVMSKLRIESITALTRYAIRNRIIEA